MAKVVPLTAVKSRAHRTNGVRSMPDMGHDCRVWGSAAHPLTLEADEYATDKSRWAKATLEPGFRVTALRANVDETGAPSDFTDATGEGETGMNHGI